MNKRKFYNNADKRRARGNKIFVPHSKENSGSNRGNNNNGDTPKVTIEIGRKDINRMLVVGFFVFFVYCSFMVVFVD